MKRVSAYLLCLAAGGSQRQLGSRTDLVAWLGTSRPRGWVASAWSVGPPSSGQAPRHATSAGEATDSTDHESSRSSTDGGPGVAASAAHPGASHQHHVRHHAAHHHRHSLGPELHHHRHHAAPVSHSPGAGRAQTPDLPEQPATSLTVEQALKRPDTAQALRALGRRSRDAAARSAAADESPGPPLMAVLGAMAGVMRGLGSSGLGPFTFGLQALGRKHEEQGVVDHPPGTVPLLPGGPAALAEAERLLEAMELAHGAYRKSAAALAATTCLRVQHVRVWRSQSGRLQPGYYLAVDHPGRRVVWGIRGTLAFSDLVTDLAMAAHPLPLRGAPHAAAHWGMTHAAHWLLQQEAQHVAALLRSLRGPGGSSPYRLELVGHSLGGSVAALVAAMLREGLVEVARSAGVPPHLVSCTAFAPPAVMSPCLAAACRPYVTSVVLNHDVVPRFNADSLALLQQELQGVDWFAELQRTVMEHTMMKNITSTFGALTATTLNIIPPPSLPPPVTSAGAAAAAATTAAHTALSNGAGAAADAVQQLSAAVLRSGAFRSAIATLDEWKARMGAVPGEQAEAAVRRQAEVVRAWLQEVSNTAAAVAAGAPMADTRPRPLFPPPPGSPPYDPASAADECAAHAAAAGGGPGASGSDSGLRVVDPNSLAERLRQSVESAMSSLMAAASAGRDRFVAGANASVSSLPAMPSLPSLPAAHELPLVEPVAAASGASAGASGPPSGAAAGGAADTTMAGSRRTQQLQSGARTVDGELLAVAAAEAEAGPEAAVAASVAGVSAAGPAEEGVLAAALSQRPQDLPMLLPPGRILYIRPVLPQDHEALSAAAAAAAAAAASAAATAVADAVGGFAAAGPAPPPSAGVVSATVNLVTSSKRGGRDSAAADLQQGQQPYASNQQFVLTELPQGTNFKRMVLGRASFNEHQCRSYRRVLMALAQQM
ncbi:hypothetical protein HYH02_005032 [Chlamydomonas schloesseri]|uniref:Fungal lipase-type domain-containing protein n=1 Tax=Chlamydomonas schloesseri TaxID=2026947 RepID=A0A836B841_9CHLO|nr:hypothetical protein HYH02_005032 [Chlamydomonas schloesseri]|eukprot:KAG2450531.1 hypothetical protein HYH02_005032 [Chlamydomonas schloesseri]